MRKESPGRATLPMLVPLILSVVFVMAVTVGSARPNDGSRDTGLTTDERTHLPAWWPTSGHPAATEYVGEAACATCHADIQALQHTTPMYHAAMAAVQSPMWAQSPAPAFHEAPYTASIAKTGTEVSYSVTDGAAVDSKPAAWAFGAGEGGQTFLLADGENFIESRLSYYTDTHSLDITTGHSAKLPFGLSEALGHALTPEVARRCFGCHTTAAVTLGVFAPEKAVAGVTCEACHGPGAKHTAAIGAGDMQGADAAVLNPARLSPSDSVDFCGACHRTWSDVALTMSPNLGVVAVRFQPYGLERSRCWGKNGDKRITCIACHDPHKPLVRETVAYDANCLACHRSSDKSGHESSAGSGPGASRRAQTGATAPACKVATADCASCHMPKFAIPQTHARFTDHDIRIVRTATGGSTARAGSQPSR